MVADIEDLEKMDAPEIHAKRLNAKEVITPNIVDECVFPVADQTVKLSGGDQVLRTSTLIRDHSEKTFLENQTGLHQQYDKTHRMMMVKPGVFSGKSLDYIYRHHVEPRVKPYVPQEETFPIPYKKFGVTRSTNTTLDVML